MISPKKWVSLSLCFTLPVLLFAGCGKKAQEVREPDTSTVYVNTDGSLDQILVDADGDLNGSEEAFETYLQERLDAYNEGLEDPRITLPAAEKAQADEEEGEETELSGLYQVDIRYASYEDYQAFNGMICFVGSVSDAAAAGYVVDAEFEGTDGSHLTGSGLLSAAADLQVLILEEPVQVEVPGTIQYTTATVTITSEQTAVIEADTIRDTLDGYLPEQLEEPAYIVYAAE